MGLELLVLLGVASEVRWKSTVSSLAALFVLAVVWPLALPYSEGTRNANELPRIMQSLALADQGRWEIDALVQAGMDPGPDLARVQGKVFPNKAPLVSILGAALLKTGDALGASWTLRSFSLWLRGCTSFFPLLLLVGVSLRHFSDRYGGAVSSVAGLLLIMGTPLMSYSKLAYGHTLAASLSMIGVLLILRARESEKEQYRVFLGAFLCALSISADYMAVFWGLPLAVALGMDVYHHRRWQALQLALAGALLGILPLCAYHDAAFGTPWSTGYHHSATPEFAAKHAQGLLGLTLPSLKGVYALLLAPGGGLLWWMPLVLLGAWGLWQEQASSFKTRFEGRLFLSIFVFGLLVNLGLNFEGGWRVGPRYLLAFCPVVLPGLAFILAKERGSATKIVVMGTMVLYSLWVNQGAAALWPHFDLEHVSSPVAEVLLPLAKEGWVPHGLAFHWGGEWPALVYLAFPVAVAWYLFAKAQAVGYRDALAWIAASALGSLAALTLPRLVPQHADGAANLEYIKRVFEPQRPMPGSDPKGAIPASRPLPRL